MRTLVILNPIAGGRPTGDGLRRRLERRIEGDFACTSEAGEAESLAADAARSGYDTVIAAGGDGTVREVATGLHLGGAAPRLGIVPAGTGNDLAYSLGLPADIERAAAIAMTGRSAPLDLIRATPADSSSEVQFAANAAVTGFCGRIADTMSPAFRRWLRPIAYPLAAMGQVRDLRPYSLRLDLDSGTIEANALMVILANGEYAGGRVRLAPGASTGDGCLDLVIIHAVSPIRLVGLVPRVLRGRHVGGAGVSVHRVTSVRMESEPAMWTNLDGDTWRTGAASYRVLPGALRVAVP